MFLKIVINFDYMGEAAEVYTPYIKNFSFTCNPISPPDRRICHVI